MMDFDVERMEEFECVANVINEFDRMINNFEYEIKRSGLNHDLVDDFIYELKKLRNGIANRDGWLRKLVKKAYQEGRSDGYNEGYEDGYNDAMESELDD